ncbi:hypothetical protein WMF30_31620 [Sorangium sp. So ce134]
MYISLPPTIAELTRTIEAMPREQTADEAVAAASSTLVEYNELPAKAKAAYLLRLRREREVLQRAFAAFMEQKIAEHEKHPTAESAMQAGELAMQAGDMQRADKLFEKAAEKAQNQAARAAAYAYRGEALLKSSGGRQGLNVERVNQAAQLLEKASELKPDLHVLNLDATAKIAGRMTKNVKDIAGDAGVFKAKGLGQLLTGGVGAAKKALDTVVGSAPATPDAAGDAADFNAEGLSQLLAGDFNAAKEAFETALEFDPDNAEYLQNLSVACTYAGHFGRAAKLAMRALKLNPKGQTNNLVLATAGMRAAIQACRQ